MRSAATQEDRPCAAMPSAPVAVDVPTLRRSLGRFATGVTVVTTSVDDIDLGVTVNSFASVSLEPPLILWSLQRSSYHFERFEKCGFYAIHILAADQLELSGRFTTGRARFADIDITRGLGGAPLLTDCCATLECANERRHDGGDHVIFIGRVLRHEHRDHAPLLFHAGRYGAIANP